MTKLVNRAKMTTATTGTGTITLGSAVDGYQTFADAGVANADVVRYVIEDGDAWEIGLGTYTASGTTLTRGSIESSNADAALNLTGNAVVYVSAAAADLQELVDFADNFVLPTADGSTGQVLQTNGAGTLSFTTISGYTDSDVDTHLNTGTASSGEVLSWTGSDYDWIAVSAGATDINGLSDGYNTGSSLGLGTGSSASSVGTQSVRVGGYADADVNAVAIGYGTHATDFSISIGTLAGQNATTGTGSVGVGYYALRGDPTSKLTGSYNIGIGYQTGYDLTTGTYNFLGGYQAGTNLTTGSDNAAIGRNALDAVTTGSENVAIGKNAGDLLTTASNNIHIGAGADAISATDAQSVVIGSFAKAPTQSISIGYGSMNGSGGSFNMGVGYQASQNVAGSNNIGLGREALRGSSVSTLTGTNNIGIGYQTGYDLTTGEHNFLGGSLAGTNLTTGSNNVAIGKNALDAATTSSLNVAIGQDALGAATSGSANTAIGDVAQRAVTTGSGNVALGNTTLWSNSSGNYNVALGYLALLSTTASNNTAVGFQAGDSITTGTNNLVLGYDADASSATVSNEITLGNTSITRFRIPGIQSGASNGDVLTFNSSTGILELQTPAGGGATDIDGLSDAQSFGTTSYGLGYKALSTNNTGTNNLAFGSEVLKGGSFNATVSGSYNFASGLYSGESISTGSGNILVGGFGVGQNITSGTYNVAAGHGAANDLTTGSNNVAIGNGALDAATTGGRNIAIGQDAMGLGVATAASGDNVAIGYRAGYDLTSGTDNVMLGELAGQNVTTGADNVAIGRSAGAGITTATRTVFIGPDAGSNASNGLGIGYRAARYSTAESNTAIGNEALSDTLLTGGANTAIGFQALRNVESGTSNIAIGYVAGANITTGSNNICIGESPSSATVSNEITLGNSSITRFRVPGLGIDWTSSSLPSAPDVVKLSSIDLSNVSTAEFSLPSGYDYFTFALGKVLPASDTVYLLAQLSSNGGTSYETSYTVNYANFSGTVNNVVFTTSAAYFVGQGVGNAAGEEGISGNIKVMFPALTKDAIIEGHVAYENSDGVFAQTLTSNRVNANSAMNYIKFYFSSGNLSSGTITLYGHKA